MLSEGNNLETVTGELDTGQINPLGSHKLKLFGPHPANRLTPVDRQRRSNLCKPEVSLEPSLAVVSFINLPHFHPTGPKLSESASWLA